VKRAPPIGVGIIGLGFMGRTHLAAYRAANEQGFANRLVAVCDSDAARRSGRAVREGNLESSPAAPEERLFDAGAVRAFQDPSELLADPEVGLVSICTPTDSHVELALAALAAGKHVLVEKPLALRAGALAPLAEAARASERLCMPAMCMRFWPGWSWLAERIAKGTFGPVESAVFARLGSRPGWAKGFYDDPARSGGALFDLHVHDADFVRWCFGAPDSLASAGTLDHVTTLYRFAKGPPHVVAEGGWNHARGFAFRMRYTVVLEEATAEFEFGREPALRLAREGTSEAVALEPGTGYDGEVRHLLGAIAEGRRELAATVDEAEALTRMLEAERESLERGTRVDLPRARA
jgi:predicted dehydrogenase